MSWPTPRPGLVVRYGYLWSREADLGREEGVKDRPCAVVLAVRRGDEDVAYVLPITHAAPLNPSDAVEIPRLTKARPGLDAGRSWNVITEANVFTWLTALFQTVLETGHGDAVAALAERRCLRRKHEVGSSDSAI